MEIDFALQAVPASGGRGWAELAARAESGGFRRLYCPDHPGTGPSPMLALAAAAAVTTTIELGALVLNAGLRDPFDIAVDVATLDLLSDGRALLGLGAGHTPTEWAQRGRAFPSPASRIARYEEVADVATMLLRGESVHYLGAHVQLPDRVELHAPRPVRSRVPVVLGGNSPRLLRHAAAHADIINLTGLGRTQSDGHRHAPLWRPGDIDRRLDLIRAAQPADRLPAVLEALVQRVAITDDAQGAAAEMLDQLAGSGELTADELLASPFVLIGTASEIADRIRATARVRGITAYVVREAAVADVARIRAALAGG
jgi:probable F420-dependent oxidoreductase